MGTDGRARTDHAAMLVAYWGERLALRRAELGLTQEDVAERVGTKAQMISKYETGRAEPRISAKVRLAEALETTTEALFPWRP